MHIPTLVVYSGRIGPLYIPKRSACCGCLEEIARHKFPEYESFVQHMTESEIHGSPELAVLGALSGILAAKEVVAHVLNIGTLQTYNACVSLDPLSLKIETIKVPKQRTCRICGRNAEKHEE